MDKIIGKNISKNLSGKYSQKPLDYTKKSVTYVFNIVSERAVKKAKATGDIIGNKIADSVT